MRPTLRFDQIIHIYAVGEDGLRLTGEPIETGETRIVRRAGDPIGSSWRTNKRYRHLAGIAGMPGVPRFTLAARYVVTNAAGGVIAEFVNPFFTKPGETEKDT